MKQLFKINKKDYIAISDTTKTQLGNTEYTLRLYEIQTLGGRKLFKRYIELPNEKVTSLCPNDFKDLRRKKLAEFKWLRRSA